MKINKLRLKISLFYFILFFRLVFFQYNLDTLVKLLTFMQVITQPIFLISRFYPAKVKHTGK